MRIVIKCTRMNINQPIDLPDDGSITTIADLKAHLISKFSFGENPRIVFAGHILKDHQTLTSVGLKEDSVLYIVVPASSSAAAPAAATTPVQPKPQPQPQFQPQPQQPFAPTAAHPQPGAAGSSMANLLNNPMVDSLLANPEFMRSMIMADPTMKQLCESNPQFAAILNDPEQLRQMIEMAKNPEVLARAEMAMNQLENIPEANVAMQRIFGAVTNAQTDAEIASIRERPVEVPDAPTSANPTDAPLPNPWGSSQPPQQPQQQQPPMMGNAFSGLGQNPFSGNFFAQQTSNPGMNGNMDMGALLDNPMYQSMLQQMAQNPEMMKMMLEANPETKALMDSNPMFRSLMNNPEYLKQMFTPENLRMASQMMRNSGMGGGFGGMGGMGGMSGMGGMGGMGGMNNAGMFAGANPWSVPPYQQQPQAPPQQQRSSSYIPPLPQGASMAELEERFSEQLRQLEDMGFMDREKNIRVLASTNGSVQIAINKLFEESPY